MSAPGGGAQKDPGLGQDGRVDAIELDLDPGDEELVTAFALVVRDLALERLDLTDPLTAIEADRRLAQTIPDSAVEFVAAHLLAPPVWSVHRDATDGTRRQAAAAG
jgi:hypothetical protein